MADLKLVGAVAIKLRPDAKGFKSEAEKLLNKQVPDAKVKITVEADTKPAQEDIDEAIDEIEKGKKLSLKVGLDYDSVLQAQRQLDKALKPSETIVVKLDDEGSIAAAKAQLETLMDTSEVEMKFIPDEAGAKAVLDKINEIRREKLAIEIPFSIDDDSLDQMEEQMRAFLFENVQQEAIVTIGYNHNRASLLREIGKIDAELDKLREVTFDVNLDEESLQTARAILEAQLANEPVEIKVDYEDQASLKATRDRLMAMLSELRAETLQVTFDEEAIRADLDRINSMIQEEVEEKHDVEIPVHTTGLEIVARQLQFASRARRVPFHVVIDEKSLLIAEGILRSLSGVNVLQSAGRGLESIITSFDTFAIKSASWATAIGSIVDVAAYMTSALFTIGDGMFEIVGLAALAPAAFASVASTMIIFTAVFKDFGAAVHGIDAALKRLPPSGQKAALAVREIFASMRENISSEFWNTASDSMLRFVETALPAFSDGLVATSGKLGKVFSGILDSFTNLAAAGGLKTMYDNLGTMFENASSGATALWDAFNLLGLRGSEFLPRFGTWLADISKQFNNWLQESDRLGNINAWINDGVQSLKDMWGAAGAIIDQFKAVAQAAGLFTSGNGLSDFRQNMREIADMMLAEPFQSKLGTIFEGARQGASELNDGVQDLADGFADSAYWTGQLLTLLGRLGGDFLSGLSKTINNFQFQDGVLDGLRGLSDMIDTMEPAFDRLGDMLGNVAAISGEVFRGLGPVFNTAMGIIDDAVETLAGNLKLVAPVFLELTNNVLAFARLPIQFIAEVLNNLLGALVGLPGPLQNAAVAFGVFLLLRNQFGSFLTAISGFWTKVTSTSVNGAAATARAVANLSPEVVLAGNSIVRTTDGTVRQMSTFGTAVQTGFARATSYVQSFRPDATIAPRMAAMVTGVTTAVSRINGALSLIGGIPGLLIGGLGIAISMIGSNAAVSQQQVDDLRLSLDKVTMGATEETIQTLVKGISDIGESGDDWANFWRGVVENSKAGNETLEKLGIKVGDVARIITGSKGAFDSFTQGLRDLADAGNLAEAAKFLSDGTFPKLGDAIGGAGAADLPAARMEAILKSAEAIKKMKLDPNIFTGDNPLNTQDLEHLLGNIDEQRRSWELAQGAARLYADSLGVTVDKAREVASITQIIGDHAADAAGKIDAINRSLAILNNNGVTEQQAAVDRANDLERAVTNAKNIAESIKASRESIFTEQGLLNDQSKAARDLFGIMKEAADNVKIQAQAAYDAAILNGDAGNVAAAKATQIVKAGEADLKAIADAAGITVDELRAQWDKFFGSDWELKATFSGTTDQFLAAKAEAERLGVEFNAEQFTAWLMANPDPAKVTTAEVISFMQGYAERTFEAKMGALPAPAQEAIALVLGELTAFENDDYLALLQALDGASPGVQAAVSNIMNNLVNPQWLATITAVLDGGSEMSVRAALDLLASPRLVHFGVTMDDMMRDSVMAARGANGGLIGSLGQRIAPGLGLEYFANGGIRENHVAQISRAGGPIRVWGEKETLGEAYIPLSPAKRPRSVRILGEVARRFGYELHKGERFANGGVTIPSNVTNSSADVHIGTLVTTDMDAAVRKLNQSRRDALAVAGLRP